jgi:hypothetical protein
MENTGVIDKKILLATRDGVLLVCRAFASLSLTAVWRFALKKNLKSGNERKDGLGVVAL